MRPPNSGPIVGPSNGPKRYQPKIPLYYVSYSRFDGKGRERFKVTVESDNRHRVNRHVSRLKDGVCVFIKSQVENHLSR